MILRKGVLMPKSKIDKLAQRTILQESVKVVEKIKAFPRVLSTDELHNMDDKALAATDAELLEAKKQVHHMEDRLRSILIGGTTVTALGVMSLALPISFFIPAASIATGAGIIGGATLLGQKTGVFENAKKIQSLSKNFLHSLEPKTISTEPGAVLEITIIDMMLGESLEQLPPQADTALKKSEKPKNTPTPAKPRSK